MGTDFHQAPTPPHSSRRTPKGRKAISAKFQGSIPCLRDADELVRLIEEPRSAGYSPTRLAKDDGK